MKPYVLLTVLTLSTLTIKAQNLNEEQFAFNNVQTNVNYNLNNININENNTHNRGRSSTALSNLSNRGDNNKQIQQKSTKPKVQVQTNTSNINVNRGNVFNVNENVNIVGTNFSNINSNPVAEDKKKVVNKPVVKEYEGLDFKPSGLSGRDYSNGGKLKKGEKNIPTYTHTKHKTVHKRKPSFKKVKYRTNKCAKW